MYSETYLRTRLKPFGKTEINTTKNNAVKNTLGFARSAMNTIPTIFNETIIPYTAVGCKERIASTGISAVVLNRSGQYQSRTFLTELEKAGFDNIISIESCALHYDIEDLSLRFPFVRFILPERELNLGELINLAASDIASPLFYVFRSDMKIVAGGTAKRMAERLIIDSEEKDNFENKSGFKRLCTVPIIMNSQYEVLPTIVVPMTHRRKMNPAFLEPENEDELSLYPFDGTGIYDRKRFIGIGGFDITLNNTFWQLMDFGFRANLWGEEIALSVHLKLSYNGELPPEDFTVDESYRRFYMKNLAPVFKNDYAHLPFYRFPSYLFKSGDDLFTSWEEFKECRKWVLKNKFRWKCDARTVTNRWDSSEKTRHN